MIRVFLAILALGFANHGRMQDEYGVWGAPPTTQNDTVQLKDRDSYIVAAGKATGGLAPTLQKLKDEGKVLDASKSLMPAVVPIADEINYMNDQLRQKAHGDQMSAVNQSLTYVLLASDQPSFTGLQNPYVKHTKAPSRNLEGTNLSISRELALAIKVAQSGGNLMPEDIMRLSVEACKGDLQSALLTSHNFLKELGYAARPGAAGPAMFCQIPGTSTTAADAKAEAQRIAGQIGNGFRAFAVKQNNGKYVFDIVVTDPEPLIGKLQSLRPGNDPVVDKMGPWYHGFIGLVLGSVSTGGEITAGTWAKIEGLLRNLSVFHLFSSPPDYFKELLTERMAAESGALMDILATSLTLKPVKSEVAQGASVAFTLEATRPSRRAEVWYKWTFGKGQPVWSRELGTTHVFPDPGLIPVTVEMYDNTKLSRMARAAGSVTVLENKVVKGAWNLTSVAVRKEVGFKDQNNEGTGGNNAWSGDPRGGRIYRSWGWGYEGTPYVSPVKLEAMHVFEIPKVLKPGTSVKVRLALVDIKYTKVDPNPIVRGYTMSTAVSLAMGFKPNIDGLFGVSKGVYDGSKDMGAPTPVDQTFDLQVPAPQGHTELVIVVTVGGPAPYVEFELTYTLK